MSTLHNDLAGLLGRAALSLDVGGRRLKLYPLTFTDLAELTEWVNEQIPDPVDALTRSPGFPRLAVEAQKYAIRVAVEIAARGRRQLTSPEAEALLDSPAGVVRMLYLMARRGDPSFTPDAAAAVASRMTAADVVRVRLAAYNIDPAENAAAALDAGDPDPDAGEGPEGGGPKAGRGGARRRTGGGPSGGSPTPRTASRRKRSAG